MYKWPKNIVSWNIGKNLYLSVVFTWDLSKARMIAKSHKGSVYAGGPAVDLLPGYIEDVAIIDAPPPIPPLSVHNPFATFTTRGCPNKCKFCAVPKTEGNFKELKTWPIKPLICDNNLLASTNKHFGSVIDKLKRFPFVDFNQGLDCRRFTQYHAEKIAHLKSAKIRFAFDNINEEKHLYNAVSICKKSGLKNIGVYVLIGFNDTPDEAHYKLEYVRKIGALPNPMRYQPLTAKNKNDFLNKNWSLSEMKNTVRYYSRLNWLSHIPFSEYSHGENNIMQQELW